MSTFTFENKLIHNDYATRYIASWVTAGGDFSTRKILRNDLSGYHGFRKWLANLGLSEEEIALCCRLASNGSLEYEESAKRFMKENAKK